MRGQSFSTQVERITQDSDPRKLTFKTISGNPADFKGEGFLI